MNVRLRFRVAARDKGTLHSLGITHIVNAAHGPPKPAPGPCFYVNTGPRFYRDMTVDYYGVEADDAIEFILSPFFYPTSRYIRAALAMGGKSVTLTVILHRCYGRAVVLDCIGVPNKVATECIFCCISGAGVKAKCPCPRTGVCPLSDGCEPLCYVGAGLPDDRRGPQAAGGGGRRQAAQRHLSQPRLPAAAPQPRQEPGEGEEEATPGPNTVKTHTQTHTKP